MKSRRSSSSIARRITLVGLALALSWAAPSSARADVRLEGDWPDADANVTLDLTSVPRGRAIEELAQAAGFSVVMSSPLSDLVDVHVKDQPAGKVLALLLPEGSYVAKRSANLVSISLTPSITVQGPTPPAAAVPPAPAFPSVAPTSASERGEDRTVFGGSLTLEPQDIVHDVAVMGGNLEVYGTVTGDLAVLGGSAHVHEGAKVLGSATVLGGTMKVDEGADVSHEVSVVGGHLDRAGKLDRHARHPRDKEVRLEPDPPVGMGERAWRTVSHWGEDALSSLSLSALLFVFGTVVIALATGKSRALQAEVAARPMRTLALGLVASLAAIVVAVALCVTLIGIPVALVGVVGFLLAAYAGVTAVLTTVGEALLRHRTESAYVHLAVGCAVYFLVGLVPWLGTWATWAIFFAGVGVIVATRGAGVLPRRAGGAAYRQGYPMDGE